VAWQHGGKNKKSEKGKGEFIMKKTNNKGFSLVELIIVIAIMAILIGVLAPQYIKYVEKSRISADKDMIDSLTKAVQTACTDDDYYDTLNEKDTVVIDDSQGISSTGGLVAAIDEFYGTTGGKDTSKTFKSKAFDKVTVTITVTKDPNKSVYYAVVTDSVNGAYDPANFK
jgi:type IV pilus assembly protein PilA